jgi:hypothetical protein
LSRFRSRDALAAACGAWLAACAALPEPAPNARAIVRGPLAAQAMQPLAWTLGDLRPRRAVTTPARSVDVALATGYANIFRYDHTSHSNVTIDGELSHTELAFRIGVGERSDVEIGLPLLYAASGFLDGFVDAWHDFFALPVGRRDLRPEDEYQMTIESDGREIWKLESDGPMLGDVPVTWTQSLIVASEHALAVRAMLELPTGSETRGASNGELDWGVGLVAEQHADRWSFFQHADHLHAGEPSSFEGSGVHLRDRFELALGGEYRWNDLVSLLSTLEWSAPLTRDLDLRVINREILDFGVGAAWDVGENSRIGVSFHEDLVSNTGADFAVLVGLTTRL